MSNERKGPLGSLFSLELPPGTKSLQKLVQVGGQFESHNSGYPKMFEVSSGTLSGSLRQIVIQYKRGTSVTLSPRDIIGSEVNRIGELFSKLEAILIRKAHAQQGESSSYEKVVKELCSLGVLEIRRSRKEPIIVGASIENGSATDKGAVYLD